jgi:ABC-type phosphate transport system permease subunit
MAEHANKSVELYLKDVADARAMQMAALTQTDTFSKRFIYFFALGIVVMAFSFDFILCFQQIPTKNETIINVVVGTINGTALVSVVSFFFGSSRGSEDKNKTISELSKKE